MSALKSYSPQKVQVTEEGGTSVSGLLSVSSDSSSLGHWNLLPILGDQYQKIAPNLLGLCLL